MKILITGANRGLGLEFCRQYLQAGHYVVACCRSPVEADTLTSLAREYPSLLRIEQLDIRLEQEHLELVKRLDNLRLDLVINNAGVYGSRVQHLETLNPEEWAEVLLVNAISPLLLSKNLLPTLNQSAKIVFLSSKMGSIADNQSGGCYLYRSSKAALNAGAVSLAIDLKPKGIAVALLHPGWVQTDMGGANALISPEQSVQGLIAVIHSLDSDDSGEFINYDGQPIPW